MVSLNVESLQSIYYSLYMLLGYAGMLYILCRVSILTGTWLGKRHIQLQLEDSWKFILNLVLMVICCAICVFLVFFLSGEVFHMFTIIGDAINSLIL